MAVRGADLGGGDLPGIFHVAIESVWEAADPDGSYTWSTRGRTLADVGYIHCSFEHQVEPVAEAVYGDCEDLVVLTIDPSAVGAPIKVENLEGGAERFPHIYGPLPTAAVRKVQRLTRRTQRDETR